MSALRHPRALLQLEDSLVVCDTWSHRVLKYVPEAMAPELLAGTPNSCAPASQCRRDVHRGGSSEQQLSFPSSVAFLGPALLVPRHAQHAHGMRRGLGHEQPSDPTLRGWRETRRLRA